MGPSSRRRILFSVLFGLLFRDWLAGIGQRMFGMFGSCRVIFFGRVTGIPIRIRGHAPSVRIDEAADIRLMTQ
jgi:hypothetical protein